MVLVVRFAPTLSVSHMLAMGMREESSAHSFVGKVRGAWKQCLLLLVSVRELLYQLPVHLSTE